MPSCRTSVGLWKPGLCACPGPFANIAHGQLVHRRRSDRLQVGRQRWVRGDRGPVSARDIGMEKFMDIKCRYSGLIPDVIGDRGHHPRLEDARERPQCGGAPAARLRLHRRNLELLEKGTPNMMRHIRNAKHFGVPVVVAVNSFKIRHRSRDRAGAEVAVEAGAEGAHKCTHWMHGGKGAVGLAKAVVIAADKPKKFKFTLSARHHHQAKDQKRLPKKFMAQGRLSIRPKQTRKSNSIPNSVSTESDLHGEDASVVHRQTRNQKVRRLVSLCPSATFAPVSARACYPLVGSMRTMPGLPTRPVFMDVDLDLKTGR